MSRCPWDLPSRLGVQCILTQDRTKGQNLSQYFNMACAIGHNMSTWTEFRTNKGGGSFKKESENKGAYT